MSNYQTDFYQWAVQQADALRHKDYAELDIANLIEELENIGQSDRRELKSRLTTIIEHWVPPGSARKSEIGMLPE